MCYRERRKEKNKVKEIELLAPAGSFEKAKIAFLYGADAVYCGTASLSLRSRAEIQDDDLIQTIKYAHSIGKKVYVALNIYAWDETYPEIIEMAKKLEEIKPDGIIAADGGVIETLKQYAPSVPINVSTQANLVSLHSCNFWYKNGAKRMIMARELNKEQLLTAADSINSSKSERQVKFIEKLAKDEYYKSTGLLLPALRIIDEVKEDFQLDYLKRTVGICKEPIILLPSLKLYTQTETREECDLLQKRLTSLKKEDIIASLGSDLSLVSATEKAKIKEKTI